MRKLNQKFEDMFKNEYNGIIQYVKKNDKVFLGIRHNYINLYVDGGSFLKLTYHPKLNCCIGGVDNKYFVNGIKMPKGLEAINNNNSSIPKRRLGRRKKQKNSKKRKDYSTKISKRIQPKLRLLCI